MGCVLAVWASGGVARAAERVDVSRQLGLIVAKFDVPGMGVVVVRGDRVVAAGAAGVRRRGDEAAITIEDKFHLGSDTKAMTATLCAMLVEQGVLTWDTTVGQVFADDVPEMDPAWNKVTLRDLLVNRGGAPGDVHPVLWALLRTRSMSPIEARKMLLKGILKQPPAAGPGEKFIYSNAGFAIAGHMAEQAAGKPWEQLMTQRIFKPLGMDSAGFGAPGTPGMSGDVAHLDQPRGHTAGGQPVEPGPKADNPTAIAPAGRVHCTLGDWAKFVAWHLRGERAEAPGKLLTAESFKALHEPVGDYAMGWIVTRRPWAGPGGRTLTHSGSNTVWFSVVWMAPDKGEGFAVLVGCNQGGDKVARACDAAAGAMIQKFGGTP